jgi:formylglycine-generating enzyme required for sulfatase activity
MSILRDILVGIVVTLIGGVMIAWVIRDARFDPARRSRIAAETMTTASSPTQAPTDQVREKDGAVMVYVPSGEFWMGGGSYAWERPRHKVYLDAFWIDRTEVTNAQYAQCVQATVCGEPGEVQPYSDPDYADHPVVLVSWSDAVTFCQWVGGRLPTEAEWEKAAGWDDAAQQKYVYPWGDDPPTCERALFYGCQPRGTTVPVGSKSPAGDSWCGAADMAGNVVEWVRDWYDRDYYGVSTGDNPTGPELGLYKATRGGGWASTLDSLRVAHRGNLDPETRYDHLGFRCVGSPGE